MSQEQTTAALVEGAAPPKRKPGRPRNTEPKIKRPKVRKPYGMKDASVFEGKSSKTGLSQQYRGFCGKCAKIKVVSNRGEVRFPMLLDLKLGDLPAIHVLVNKEVIVPIEAVGILNDTAVQIPASGVLPADSGPREDETFVRIPYMFLGDATWDEYEAFLASERSKPILPTKKQ